MDDTIILGVHLELGKSEFSTVLVESINLLATYRVGNRLVLIVSLDIMVRHTVNLLWTKDLQPTLTKSVESLRRCHLMTIESVNI